MLKFSFNEIVTDFETFKLKSSSRRLTGKFPMENLLETIFETVQEPPKWRHSLDSFLIYFFNFKKNEKIFYQDFWLKIVWNG